MESSWLYLSLNVLSIAFPLAYSWDKRVEYHKKFKPLFLSIAAMMLVFIPWDIYFTQLDVWGFNSKYITKIHLINLPIEEWLFFICIPFSSIFIYECVIYYFPKISTEPKLNILVGSVFGLLLIIAGLLFREKMYTFWTFFGAGILVVTSALLKSRFIVRFLISYIFILFPFFIVNGILTGSFIEQEVVWYNNNENLGIRIFTIPIEDSIYGFFMLYLSVFIYECQLKRL